MKSASSGFRTIAATMLVLSLLTGGAVYAYSTRSAYSGSQLNALNPAHAPQADADAPAVTTTSSSTTTEHEHEGDKSTTTTATHSSDGACEEDEAEEEAKSTTSTTTSTSTTCQDDDEQGENEENENAANIAHEAEFKLVPIGDALGRGEVNVQIHGTNLDVKVEVEHASESTTYTVILVSTLSTTSATTSFSTSSAITTTPSTSSGTCPTGIGTLVTSDEGHAEGHFETTLAAGTYQLGVVLCSAGASKLMTDPATRTVIVGQSEGKSETESEETSKSVSEHEEDQDDKDKIKGAEDSKQIPAVVTLTKGGADVSQLDPKFSVSVGRTQNNGVLVSISANNVTGPRVLLVDIPSSAYSISSLQSLVVTLDGQQISQASSLAQVLGAKTGDPASFIVLLYSGGAQLLVNVPHFSAHLIEIIPSAIASAIPFGLNGVAIIAAITVVTIVTAAVYAKRKRAYALMA